MQAQQAQLVTALSYCRVSTEDQAEKAENNGKAKKRDGLSLHTQVAEIKRTWPNRAGNSAPNFRMS